LDTLISSSIVLGDNNLKDETIKTLEILEGKFQEKKKILLPRNKGTRNIILIQPKNFCPEIYPRKVGKPEKNPL